MAIGTAEKRKAVSGIPFGAPGITPNASPDREWRFQAGNSWYYVDDSTTYTSNDDPIDLPADVGIVSLPVGLPGVITNYLDGSILVNQNGDTLVNQNGDTLIGFVIRSTRADVVDLGA